MGHVIFTFPLGVGQLVLCKNEGVIPFFLSITFPNTLVHSPHALADFAPIWDIMLLAVLDIAQICDGIPKLCS